MNADEIKAQAPELARRYSMTIEWSDRDQVYIVSLPEWEKEGGLRSHTHGATYEEAVRMGEELLELLVESALAHGETLPTPKVYAAAGASSSAN
jgi:predicted RNase H-like HicB family nuclease